MRRNVETWERVASVAAGAALLALAVRESRVRRVAGTTGAGLIMRGLTGFCPVNAAVGRGLASDDTRVALGGSRGVHVRDTITILRPASEIYDFWRQLTTLPHFLSHIERVDVIDQDRSHWVVRGPAGSRVEWDAEIINDIEDELIAWRSLPGSDVVSAGSVRFEPGPGGGTAVCVHFQYEAPAGRLGSWVASLFGKEPSQQIGADLRRLRQVLDTGNAAAGGGPRTRREPLESGLRSRRSHTSVT